MAVKGSPGSGSTTVALTLAAAATAAGEWAAVVDLAGSAERGTLGARAAAVAGVELERLAVVRNAPPDRWAAVVAALLDGITVVVAAVPPHLRLGDARRLVARARERRRVLVAFGDVAGRSRAARPHRSVARGGASARARVAGGARSAHRGRRERGRGARARRDDAYVLRVVPRLAGGRGPPPGRVVADGAGCRTRARRLTRARARRVGRGPSSWRDARHAAPRGRGPVSRAWCASTPTKHSKRARSRSSPGRSRCSPRGSCSIVPDCARS